MKHRISNQKKHQGKPMPGEQSNGLCLGLLGTGNTANATAIFWFRAMNPSQNITDSACEVVDIKAHLVNSTDGAFVIGGIRFHGGNTITRIQFAYVWSDFQHFGGMLSRQIFPFHNTFSFITDTNA